MGGMRPLPDLSTISKTYDYVDEHGHVVFQVVRYDPKAFRVRRPAGQGEWVWEDIRHTRRLLYRLPEVIRAQTVVILEGEKDADTLRQLPGFPGDWAATSAPFGAGQWRSQYSEMLRGKTVYICPDTDRAGMRHSLEVSNDMLGKVPKLAIIRLPSGKDLAEWVQAGGTVGKFMDLVHQAQPVQHYRLDRDETSTRVKVTSVANPPRTKDTAAKEKQA